MRFKKQYILIAICALFAFSGSVFAQKTKNDVDKERKMLVEHGIIDSAYMTGRSLAPEGLKGLGGAIMIPKISIIENIVRSKRHVNISEALVATSFKDMLDEDGTYTLFAPEDVAFGNLDEGLLGTLTAEGNEKVLEDFAGNHVVKGNYTMAKIKNAIKNGNGRLELRTVSGMRLFVLKRGAKYVITDETGNRSYFKVPDVEVSNGVIHGVDGVLLKKKPLVSEEK